jgi:hypothetical protein
MSLPPLLVSLVDEAATGRDAGSERSASCTWMRRAPETTWAFVTM